MITGRGYVDPRIPAVLRPDTPRGYAPTVLRLPQDNGTHRDDNRTMTDEQNGNAGAASPFGGMQINFGDG